MAEEEKAKITILYMGVEYEGNKKVDCWYLLDGWGVPTIENGDSIKISDRSRALHYTGKPIITGAYPGSIWVIMGNPDKKGSVFPGTGVFVEQWHDELQVIELQAIHRANRDEHAQHTKRVKELRKISKVDSNRLEPFRKAYHRMPAAQRKHLLAWIIDYITS